MRHLLNTYIQADAVDEIGDLQSLSLGELIIKTGIHDAIARKINQKVNFLTIMLRKLLLITFDQQLYVIN